MTVDALFARWRTTEDRESGCGLAWYLSHEICRRFYRSHGIAPFVLNHGGLGCYGIEIAQLPCRCTGQKDHTVLGRITMAGDVENWITGSPGDHGCDLSRQCAAGAEADDLVAQAIRHLRLPAVPLQSHNACHHKRRGDSYVLLWEIATILALQSEQDGADVRLLANGLRDGKPFVGLDGPPMTYRKPGHFWFGGASEELYVTAEGVLCDGSGESLWERYMAGESPAALAAWIRQRLL